MTSLPLYIHNMHQFYTKYNGENTTMKISLLYINKLGGLIEMEVSAIG